MPKIQILPEQLANQIAAGEVVERPASVVKELIENSLDAGADRIEIEIEGGGTRLIRIIDNGTGMDEDDLFLCIERHGTSKIAKVEDLTAITTLGFRGEAIPSIASVSQMSITSRSKDSALGYRLELKYGSLMKSHEAGCPVGTNIEIRNLFGNTPARRKFLRTVRTELNHIDEIIKNYSLASPDVSFILRIDGRETINFDRNMDISKRLSVILRHQDDFLPIQHKSDEAHRLEGLFVSPEKVNPGPARLRIFVNGRAVKDRMIMHAVAEGMRGFLMKGKNPAGLIQLFLPADEIDVNVHPAKHEIRFRHSRDIHKLVTSAVFEAIKNEQAHLQQAIFGNATEPPTPIPASERVMPTTPLQPSTTEVSERAGIEQQFTSPTIIHQQENIKEEFGSVEEPSGTYQRRPTLSDSATNFQSKSQEKLSSSPQSVMVHHGTQLRPSENTRKTPETGSTAQPDPNKPYLEIMGQVDNLYIFCKTIKGIVVIDQHAAHERLLYEKLKHHFAQNSMVKQNLLFPETVELSVFQAQLVEKNQENLDRMGFSIRDFGGNSYIISAIPALAGQLAPQKIFFDVLEQFGSESSKTGGDILDTILATMACRAAVKAGTGLSPREIGTLLDEMAAANLFSHCPHGRPVVKQFNSDEIKKWFYRT